MATAGTIGLVSNFGAEPYAAYLDKLIGAAVSLNAATAVCRRRYLWP